MRRVSFAGRKVRGIDMTAENITGLVIVSLVALVMLIIGIGQLRRTDAPVGFYNLASPPGKDEITDITAWNRKHGVMWIIYGICIEAGFWLGFIVQNEVAEMICYIGGIVLPLPCMVARHICLVKRYKKV